MAKSPSVYKEKPIEIISGRLLVGLIGLMALIIPILLVIISMTIDDCKEIQSSISSYYHTGSRDAFVGIICAISFSLFAYKGYGNKKGANDSIIANLAAVFALGVAFFPTNIDGNDISTCIAIFDNKIYGKVHYVSAILFFFTLAFICIMLFTKVESDKYCFSEWKTLRPRKKSVNRFYIFCGGFILLCMAFAGIFILTDDGSSFKESIREYNPIFWLETLMLWSFAAAWLRKSKFLGIYTNNELE